jgi:glycosyl transferase, family 25
MLVLINLDAAVERRSAMSRQLQQLGLGFERVGVDLRCVRPAEAQAQIDARFPGLQFDRERLSNAEIGCWLSHLSAWRLLAQSSNPTCTVIEDDLQLLPDFAAAHAALSRRTQRDIVYLGTSSRNVSQRRRSAIDGLWVHEPVGIIFNTWGYSIRREYVQRFFAAGPRRLRLPIDHFLGGKARCAPPSIGVLQPPALVEDPVLGRASQIAPYTRRLDRSRVVEALRRRLLASPLSAAYYALYRYF